MRSLIVIALLSAVVLAAKGPSLTLTSTAFASGQRIPDAFTCKGENRSPALAWSGAPAATKSFVLLCEDPDAPMGNWVHWVLYDIAPGVQGIAENGAIPGAVPGRNSWGKSAYGGPCPPPGKPHRYFFRLYALKSALTLPAGAVRSEVQAAMKGHVLATAELMGTYGK